MARWTIMQLCICALTKNGSGVKRRNTYRRKLDFDVIDANRRTRDVWGGAWFVENRNTFSLWAWAVDLIFAGGRENSVLFDESRKPSTVSHTNSRSRDNVTIVIIYVAQVAQVGLLLMLRLECNRHTYNVEAHSIIRQYFYLNIKIKNYLGN